MPTQALCIVLRSEFRALGWATHAASVLLVSEKLEQWRQAFSIEKLVFCSLLLGIF